MKRRKFLIIGLGRFGSSLVEALWDARAEVVAIDMDERAVDSVKDRTSAAFVGDASDPAVLTNIGAEDLDAAIVTFGEDFEGTVLCVASLAKLGVGYVVARAGTRRQAEILKTVGAQRLIELESDMGHRMAHELLTPVSADLVEFAQGYRVVPWRASGPLVGKTLAQTNLRQEYEINVLGYRPSHTRSAQGIKPRLRLPGGDYVIGQGDTLMLVGEEENVNRFVEEVGGE